jgi:hypothetical protein
LSAGYAQDVSAAVVDRRGVRTVEVRVRAPIPLVGLFGAGSMTITGHAVPEVS